MSKHYLATEETTTFGDGFTTKTKTKRIVRCYPPEEPYYAMFLNRENDDWIHKIKYVASFKLLYFSMYYAEFNTGRVNINTDFRRLFVAMTGVSVPSYYSALHELEKFGVLVKDRIINEDTGEEIVLRETYMVNPKLCWKGERNIRAKLLAPLEAKDDENTNVSDTEKKVWESTASNGDVKMEDR